jgi:ferredoxin-NADP reductase
MSEESKKNWQKAKLVKALMAGADLRTLKFDVQNHLSYEPGQYYEIKLIVPNGFEPDRPFSVANSYGENEPIEFGIQLLPQGEVSQPLFALEEGREVEVRGPYGDDFIWNTDVEGPLYLIGGGSGLVPLMSMLRHHLKNLEKDSGREIVCLFSAKDESRMYYKEELREISAQDKNIKIVWTSTGAEPSPEATYNRRIDEAMIQEVFAGFKEKNPRVYVCGSTPFAVSAIKNLMAVGFNPNEIKTERFGG